VEELIEQFIRERIILKNVTPKTVAWYRHSFKAFEGTFNNRSAIIERIGQLRERGVAAISVNTYLRCVNAFHRWANTEGHLVGELVHIPRSKQEEKVLATLTEDQIQRVVSFKPKSDTERRVHTLACLLLDCGLRIDEALSLVVDDVDIDGCLLRVRGKGGKHRMVPFSGEMRKILWKYIRGRCSRDDRKGSQIVLATRAGTKPIQRNLLREFKQLGEMVGISGVRFSFHTMRHTFATVYIRRGGDVFRLQRVLGHSTLAMTQKYVNVQTSDLSEVHDRLSVVGKGGLA
jgi:integrase/recombinase XerD